MSKPIPFLEFRATGFYWRRRVPVAVLSRYSNSVFCFPLKTNVLREAAAVASRITAISDSCFRAEIDVSPDVMTKLLVTYARLEIEASDRLRALTGPQTRAAAEAGLALETAIRASLRDAIFLCEREPAFQAVESTARHLGIEIAEDDEDLPILVDKMMRLMLELSEERERRAQGYFSDRQPYLAMALSAEALVMSSAPLQGREPKVAAAAPVDPVVRPMFVSRREMATPPVQPGQDPVETGPSSIKFEQEDASFSDSEQTAAGQIVAPQPVLFEDGGVSLTFRQEGAAPTSEEPSIVGLFDIWFDFRLKGCLKHGAYEITDAGLANSFSKNSDTDKSTRKILADFFGDRRVSEVTKADWQAFLTFLLKIPTNHGKSPKLRHLPLSEIIRAADLKDKACLAKAQKAAGEQNRKAHNKPVTQRRSEVKGLVPRLSARTVQRHQMTLKSVLDHAVETGLIAAHDFGAYVLKDKTVTLLKSTTADTKRLLWGNEFDALLATKKWNSPKTCIDDDVYWAPLIARMHGLRSEEILQLNVGNIRVIDGIAVFDIVQGSGQSLKSNNARRMIPIHSQLLELGFMELVDRQRRNGEKRLFPRATRCKSAKLSYTSNFTKRFAHYRKSNNVYNERMDFHALRTTFNSDAVAARIPDTARRYLMGHDNPDVGIMNYLPEGFPLATLKDIIEHRQYDLSMVTQRFGKGAQRPKGPVLAVSNVHRLPRTIGRKSKVAS